MKYIRTKDGIQALYIDEFTEYGKEYYKNCKIADTIEELCDVYVEEYLDYKSVIPKSDLYRGEDGSWRKEVGLPEHKIKIYGAIWVGVDLKSIAKMNEKGELELL